MVSSAQMIITRWGPAQAVSLSSPQLPGIVAAFDDDPSPADVLATAVAAGLDVDGEIDVHTEDVIVVGGVQYFVRAKHDYHADARIAISQRVVDQIVGDSALRDYAVADSYGDVLFVTALPTDSIGSALSSAERGQPVTVSSIDPQDEHIMCIAIVRDADEPNGPTLEALGLSERSTVHALLQMKSRLRNHDHHHELVQA